MISSAILEKLSQSSKQIILQTIANNPDFLKNPNLFSDESIFFSKQDIFILAQQYDFFEISKMHSHNFFEINYVIEGHCTQFLNDEKYELEKGDFCILSPSARHNIYIEDNSMIVLNIAMSKSLFNNAFFSLMGQYNVLGSFLFSYLYSQRVSSDFLLFRGVGNESVEIIINAILHEYLNDNLLYKETSIRCMIILLFTEIIRQQVNISTSDSEVSVITQILQYIAEHYSTATLQSTAEEFHYHPNYLSALIKKHSQKTFSELINQVKTAQAIYYLTNTDIPIKEISNMLGYKELSTFYSMIKKNYHMTPTQMRQNKKQILTL